MKSLTTLLIIVLSATVSSGQITVTLDDVQNQYELGTRITEKIDTVARDINIGNEGTGNYWDFSSLNVEAHIVYESEIISPEGTPFESEFPEASRVTYVKESVLEATGELWWYGGFPESNVVSYGYGSISKSQLGEISAVLKSAPAEVGGVFPMTLGTSWSYSGSETYVIKTGLIPIETDAEVTVEYIVDAAGVLKLPNGREVEALRLYEIRSREVSIFNGITETYSEILFTFFSKTGEEVSVTLLSEEPGTTSGTVTADALLWNDGDMTSAVKISETVPSAFRLKQNYPNPFNPATTIEYSVSEPAHVSIKVYDILGNEVATLVSGYQSAGTYKEEFNAGSLASGNYCVQMQAGSYSEVRKITLVK